MGRCMQKVENHWSKVYAASCREVGPFEHRGKLNTFSTYPTFLWCRSFMCYSVLAVRKGRDKLLRKFIGLRKA